MKFINRDLLSIIKVLDFAGQTIMFALLVSILTFGLITSSPLLDIAWLSLILLFIWFTPWQIISALILSIATSSFRASRIGYILAMSIDITFLILIRSRLDGLYGDYLTNIGLVAAIILATFYYLTTVRTFTQSKIFPDVKHFFANMFHKILKV